MRYIKGTLHSVCSRMEVKIINNIKFSVYLVTIFVDMYKGERFVHLPYYMHKISYNGGRYTQNTHIFNCTTFSVDDDYGER